MTLSVAIDWLKDGDFTDFGDDVTARVRPGMSRAEVSYGRDQTTALTPIVSGHGSMTLDNRSRDYSPRNTASPLYGLLKPARPVQLQRTVSGTTYTLFRGHTDDSPINPDVSARTVSLGLVDTLADFARVKVSTALYSGLRTGDAIGLVLDAVGWTGGRDLDAGVTYIAWWWLDGVDALTALQDLVASEGPPALLTVGPSGEVVFRDRHHRLTRASSLTSQSTWRGSGAAEPVMLPGFSYDESWKNVVNSASAAVDVRAAGDLGVVWSSTGTVTLTDGETKLITATGTDPFFGAIAPDPTLDMTVASGTVSAALTRDSGGSTTILLTASGGPATVTSMQLRAIPVPVQATVQVSASDTQSIADYGPRGYPTQMPWAGPGDADAILRTIVAQRAQPLTILTVSFQVGGSRSVDLTRAAAILALDLSDRVTVIEPETQTSGDFFIESISHSLTGDVDHVVTLGLEATPAQQVNVLRFDTAGQGFDQGMFGSGLDDPANMFRFDSTSGHRFDEGVFAS